MELIKNFFTVLIIEWPHEFWLRMNRRLKYLIDTWRIKAVIREADMLNKRDGKRYFVLRDGHGYPIAVNRLNIIALKKAGIMSRKVNVFNLYAECLYYTGQRK